MIEVDNVRYYDTDDLADILGETPRQVIYLRTTGRLIKTTFHKRSYVSEEHLKAFLEAPTLRKWCNRARRVNRTITKSAISRKRKLSE